MADRRLSDVELRNAELTLSDPYAQDNLVESIPVGATLISVLNTYVLPGYPKQKAWCAKCEAHRHKRGCTGELSTGQKVMVGSACGRNVFGRSCAQLHRDLKDNQKRQRYLRDFDDLAPRLATLGTAITKWWPSALALNQSHLRFRTALPELFEALQQSALRGGALTAFVKIDASERAKYHGGPSFEWVSSVYHQMAGWQYLVVADATAVIDDSSRLVKRLVEACANTEAIGTSRMVKLNSQFSAMVEDLHAFELAYQAWQAFFNRANLAKVAEWATQAESPKGTYKVDGHRLVHVQSDKGIELPANYRALDETLMRLLAPKPAERSHRRTIRASRRQ